MVTMPELAISPSGGSDWFSECPQSTAASWTLRHGGHGLKPHHTPAEGALSWQRSHLLLSRKHPGAA